MRAQVAQLQANLAEVKKQNEAQNQLIHVLTEKLSTFQNNLVS